jgi:hypothetical protein
MNWRFWERWTKRDDDFTWVNWREEDHTAVLQDPDGERRRPPVPKRPGRHGHEAPQTAMLDLGRTSLPPVPPARPDPADVPTAEFDPREEP